MTIEENFITRLDNADTLVIGASYTEEDYNFWKTIDLNYIGFARTYGVEGEQVRFLDGNPLDFDWNTADVANVLKTHLTNKIFKEIYIDRSTMQHIQNLDVILNYLFNYHLAADGKFYFPAYQEPIVKCNMKCYAGPTERDYERLKDVLGDSLLHTAELGRKNYITGDKSIYSFCKNPCKNSKSTETILKKQKKDSNIPDSSSSSSTATTNSLLFSNSLNNNDEEIARQLQLEFDKEHDEEMARQLQLQFDSENYRH